jgi:hypothetical protein
MLCVALGVRVRAHDVHAGAARRPGVRRGRSEQPGDLQAVLASLGS